MAIEFLGDDFFANRGSGALAQMGATTPEPMSAAEAFEFFGEYGPRIVKASFEGMGDVDLRGIFLPDRDGNYKLTGTVKGRYQAVTPQDFVELWDRNMNHKVSAMGAGGKIGEVFFLASELNFGNEFTEVIPGDPLKTHLLAISPMNGKGSIRIMITKVRWFCKNQLMPAIRRASVTARIPHTGDVVGQIDAWMRHLGGIPEQLNAKVEADLKVMAQAEITEQRLETFSDMVYTLPSRPAEVGTQKVLERQGHEYEMHRAMVEHRREAFQELLGGKMTGYDNLEPTMYKVYQAAVEQAQYWRSNQSTEQVAGSVLFGKRATELQNIYDAALLASR